MTLTFDLLTSKSIGRILDSWWVSVWSFMIIGWLQSQLSSGNHFQITMRHDLDLWPFDLKINRAHPWLMVSKCMKFHDHRLITESVIVRKPFSNNHAPWPWPFDLKINRAHPWLMVSKCMKFHDHWLITESVIVRKPFSKKLVWRTDRQTECKPIVPSGFTGGGLISRLFVIHTCILAGWEIILIPMCCCALQVTQKFSSHCIWETAICLPVRTPGV